MCLKLLKTMSKKINKFSKFSKPYTFTMNGRVKGGIQLFGPKIFSL